MVPWQGRAVAAQHCKPKLYVEQWLVCRAVVCRAVECRAVESRVVDAQSVMDYVVNYEQVPEILERITAY
ncbi:hypothetical protein Y032_0012g1728 [Ancylostoma ceylanicum]|uniref:Uncharacterized protein n=1 Tax=Ancylostoma ceylanicum TaxID=53326 RepID=A0A016VEJ3_9BILA|nr:hypothetical protein Y032_0012g1728 [Ancylostoma ceylanicum]